MRAFSKIALCAAFLVLSAVFLCFPFGAQAASDVYVVEGKFESLEKTEEGLVITLIVKGQKASGPVSASCKYYDHGGKAVSQKIFKDTFLGEPVTVEIADNGEVTACLAVRFYYTN
jgi:hypothetical protein